MGSGGRSSELGADTEETIDELRSLAHGVYPALLVDHGLASRTDRGGPAVRP